MSDQHIPIHSSLRCDLLNKIELDNSCAFFEGPPYIFRCRVWKEKKLLKKQVLNQTFHNILVFYLNLKMEMIVYRFEGPYS